MRKKSKVSNKKDIWLNNYLYFKIISDTQEGTNINNNQFPTSVVSDKLFFCYLYKYLNNKTYYLNNKFCIVNKISKYSLINSIKKNKVFGNDIYLTKRDLFAKFFNYYHIKDNSAFTYINNWLFFNNMSPDYIDIAYLYKFVNKLVLYKGKIFNYLDKYNRINQINLISLRKSLNPIVCSHFKDLPSKYKDFLYFILFKIKGRN